MSRGLFSPELAALCDLAPTHRELLLTRPPQRPLSFLASQGSQQHRALMMPKTTQEPFNARSGMVACDLRHRSSLTMASPVFRGCM